MLDSSEVGTTARRGGRDTSPRRSRGQRGGAAAIMDSPVARRVARKATRNLRRHKSQSISISASQLLPAPFPYFSALPCNLASVEDSFEYGWAGRAPDCQAEQYEATCPRQAGLGQDGILWERSATSPRPATAPF